MKTKLFHLVGFCIWSIMGISQITPVGTWADYLSFNSVTHVDALNDKIYGATASGIIVGDISDNSFITYSKSNGLTGSDITSMAVNESTNALLVGYSNGRLDLVEKDRVTAIIDISNKNIPGNKRINDIYMDSIFAYLATGFGIVKYNMERKEFVDTYIVSSNGSFLNVNQVTIFKDSIYAATTNGIRYVDVNNPNISYYGVWQLDTTLADPLLAYSKIKSNSYQLFTTLPHDTIPDELFEKDSGDWNSILGLQGERIVDFDLTEDRFTISHQGFISSYDSLWNEIDRVFDYGSGKTVTCNAVKIRNEQEIIVGDNGFSLVHIPKPFTFNLYQPKSPPSNDVEQMDIYNNQVVVAPGGRLSNFNNVFSNEGVYFRGSDLEWSASRKWDYPVLDGVFDIITVAINKSNPSEVYGGSLGGGLIQFENTVPVERYTESNSTLQIANATTDWVGVTGMAFDNSGNLWVANSRNSQAISVKTVDGVYSEVWYGFTFPALSDDKTHSLIVDQQNQKWVLLPGGKGLLVFNDNGTIDNTDDDDYKILNSSAGRGGLPSSDVYSIAEDQDGEVWVGTSQGIGVFYNPGAVFQEGVNFDAQQIILEADGYYEYLLGTETVTSIAIDGANRKWLGTAGSGAFLMSAEGTTQLYHFTAENSPLLSNTITQIKINDKTGEVLFGTPNGIVTFKGSATGEEANSEEAYAYPNPVPSNYDGVIAVKGIPANSNVRITDIAGNLVFETIAEGTQMVWDGNDMNGNRVGTGIYLVMATVDQGGGSKVVKIMISE